MRSRLADQCGGLVIACGSWRQGTKIVVQSNAASQAARCRETRSKAAPFARRLVCPFPRETPGARPTCRDAQRLRDLRLAERCEASWRIAREPGCEPLPSVRIATTGGRPAAQHAAINPPQPRLSSSGCGASTRHVPEPATSSRVPMGNACHCACRSLTFKVEHPATGEQRNAPPPRSAPHRAPAGADRLRDRGKSARPASHAGTLQGRVNAAPVAWHQDTRFRRRCAQGPYRRQPPPDRCCGSSATRAACRTHRRLVSQAIMAFPSRAC